MAATEKSMGDLHALVERAITERLEAENEGLLDGLIPHASTLNAAIVFLKHNNITCAPDDNAGESDFAKMIAKKKAERLAMIPHDLEH